MRRAKDEIGKLTKKEKETVVSNMFAVMLLDEKVHPKEERWFEVACWKLGFTPEETQAYIDKLRENPKSLFNAKKFTPAKDVRERLNQLYPVVLMMMSDDVIDDREMEWCRWYATMLGFGSDIVSGVIESMTEGITQDHDRNTISAEIEEFLEK